MGLSRNKVSLRERGDGSPPFYGEIRKRRKEEPYEILGDSAKESEKISHRRLKIDILLGFERRFSQILFFEN